MVVMRPWLFLLCASAAIAQPAIDFSYAGYAGGGVPAPAVPAVISVRPTGGDDTALLQAALDHVAALPLRRDGFRGAVELRSLNYRVSGQLIIRASGVVLRGTGAADIIATGTSRRTLIEIGGLADPKTGPALFVADETVPAGARTLALESLTGLKVGDRIVITRPSTTEWITALHMNKFPGTYANQRLDWAPGSRNLIWDRTVTAISVARKSITIDAPITTALERRYGGGVVQRVEANGPLTHIGVEAITLESEFEKGRALDEDHAWTAISMDRLEDSWVRNVTVLHFAASAIRVGHRARRISVEGCANRQPVSEAAGYRRQSFLVEGQQVLVRKCTADQGMNDFASGLLAGGPNVFLDDTASSALGASGSFESWASGILYERVHIDGAGIHLANDSSRAEGAGWTAANSVVWDSAARDVLVQGPEGAENIMDRSNEPLYEGQLAKRTGAHLVVVAAPNAFVPASEFHAPPSAAHAAPKSRTIEIVNGRFAVDGKAVWGGVINEGWWRGQEVPAEALDVGGVSVTRFVPGRTGPGLTEDLDALASRMEAQGTPFYQSVPGLWYDRRRDEHSINMRPDANVWAPFYEMPWARSGTGTAFDGLTQFDLTRFNGWYYERLRDFAALCDRYGLVFYHNIYNTHNLLEIPPHWADYPWRSANNINDTGLPEDRPPVANQVYDVSNPVRRELHRALILHELDQLGSLHNLFFSLGAQFAGPLAFQEFFQDTVAEWERKSGHAARIELATSKDITDAILANPERARQVAVIDTQYWQYRPDGSLWAPAGGRNVAFREAIVADFGKSADTPPDTTPQQVYRLVREYHDRYPDKAIVAWNGGAGPIPILMAGGAESLNINPSGGHGQGHTVDRTTLDAFVRDHLATALTKMKPRDGAASDAWCLADDEDRSVLFYSLTGDAIRLSHALSGAAYRGLWFDPRSGTTHPAEPAATDFKKPSNEPWLLLLTADLRK
jgi:hypothetical protein